MRIERILTVLAVVAAALFLLGATGGGRYHVESIPLGGTMGSVRIDTGTGEVCFYGVIPDRYAPLADSDKPPTGGQIACYK